MPRKTWGFGMLPLLVLLAATAGFAQTPVGPRPLSSASILALAIYEANIHTSDELPDHLVNYNVTDAAVVDAIFSGIDFATELDCTLLEADKYTYMYVKMRDGSRKVYDFYAIDSHVALKDRRVPCFWVSESARSVLAAHKQPQ
ncbi:MAG TPA: hypothetical protein VF756_09725 [Thermoanaerobaculia bacterium]